MFKSIINSGKKSFEEEKLSVIFLKRLLLNEFSSNALAEAIIAVK